MHFTSQQLPFFVSEVWQEIAKGRHPAVVIFVGQYAQDLAERHRIQNGSGSALALDHSATPEAIKWPPMIDPVVQDSGALPALLLRTAASIHASVTIRDCVGQVIQLGGDRAA